MVFQITGLSKGRVYGVAGYACTFPVATSFEAGTLRMPAPEMVAGSDVVEAGTVSIMQRASRLSANPRRQASLERARKRLGEWLGKEDAGTGLAALRLKAGLSQTELGHRIGMAQPNVSRLEREPGDPSSSTVRSLAKALNVSADDVLAALESCRASTGHEHA